MKGLLPARTPAPTHRSITAHDSSDEYYFQNSPDRNPPLEKYCQLRRQCDVEGCGIVPGGRIKPPLLIEVRIYHGHYFWRLAFGCLPTFLMYAYNSRQRQGRTRHGIASHRITPSGFHLVPDLGSTQT
ncbi:hypothetical protein Cob_v000870 [Colletotrichum orbiculare MAFF 240422]|uniref:Uncharacterized protein n=1 Tax=Colletotrichum orbiculare (strain 104-T / ATCC 96160 / CBS 514.97 / LARS 414 / MAFF 240422) TaxID=1213857 RepID=A0A484G677_COLOR|nr:hypothetical protein Cob_v000870 [Colletotrichum orbiculare MAFF 240422]